MRKILNWLRAIFSLLKKVEREPDGKKGRHIQDPKMMQELGYKRFYLTADKKKWIWIHKDSSLHLKRAVKKVYSGQH